MTQEPYDWDEHGQPKGKRESRMERKRASARDRSRFKKTDQDKALGQLPFQGFTTKEGEEWLRGRVLSVAPEGYEVVCEGKSYRCQLRGVLKKDRTLVKNLVTVGDWVLFGITGEGEGQIVNVEERYSVLSRADNLSRRKEHILAANIDQVLITMSVVLPPIKPFLVDRYIIAAQKGNMAPVVVINKIDLLDEDTPQAAADRLVVDEMEEAYAALDIPFIRVSAQREGGLDTLKAIMKDKASVFSGQSGVGKTSLINALTGLHMETGQTVYRTSKGSHTTTSPKLVPLAFGGWCIDTPGIKSFGLWDLKVEEVQNFFPEIMEVGLRCRYPNCTHRVEPDCAVMEAVEAGELPAIRYESYLGLMDSLSQVYRRR